MPCSGAGGTKAEPVPWTNYSMCHIMFSWMCLLMPRRGSELVSEAANGCLHCSWIHFKLPRAGISDAAEAGNFCAGNGPGAPRQWGLETNRLCGTSLGFNGIQLAPDELRAEGKASPWTARLPLRPRGTVHADATALLWTGVRAAPWTERPPTPRRLS